MRTDRVRAVLAAAALLACACSRGGGDPEAAAKSVIRECGQDTACARGRWARSDARTMGLRSEIAGLGPRALFVVETTREIAAPDTGDPACAPREASALVYFRTSVSEKESGVLVALFRWSTFEEALAGHRRVAAIGVEARGDGAEIERRAGAGGLEAACVWVRGLRDSCAAPSL